MLSRKCRMSMGKSPSQDIKLILVFRIWLEKVESTTKRNWHKLETQELRPFLKSSLITMDHGIQAG